jgi:hypothetical protein
VEEIAVVTYDKEIYSEEKQFTRENSRRSKGFKEQFRKERKMKAKMY